MSMFMMLLMFIVVCFIVPCPLFMCFVFLVSLLFELNLIEFNWIGWLAGWMDEWMNERTNECTTASSFWLTGLFFQSSLRVRRGLQCCDLETMVSRLECTRVHFVQVSVSVSRPEDPGLSLGLKTACLVRHACTTITVICTTFKRVLSHLLELMHPVDAV